jgi:hypothetical protein
MEPAKRAEILRLAELFATQSQDGYTHFSLLIRDGQVSCDIPSQLTAIAQADLVRPTIHPSAMIAGEANALSSRGWFSYSRRLVSTTKP